MSDFPARRTMMVDTQVRPSDVTSFPIIDAMLSVPREKFVPTHLREAAYAGEILDFGNGRGLIDPRTFAKILEAADIGPTDLVLDIGCLHGYSAAVAAKMAEAVIAIEDTAEMCAEAEAMLSEAGIDNVAVLEGSLSAGAPKHQPYDVILIEGAVSEVPDAIIDQLKEDGRIVAVFVDGHLGTVKTGYKSDQGVTWRYAFNAGAPVLPGFERSPEFSF
ncbi:MAG: protein-L-isoaspartate O-methyltransferase [Boseongicola sp.]|nr:protein-L-isoaspartate O-methyltransferase [Boseongicola sp.]MDD9977540.1 protein-L-isoaspartate O-methyltransferase [Boseongicola sp.]